MDIQGTPLGWDPKKKAARDRERDIAISRKRIGDLYSDHVNRLTKRARTRREIIQWLYDLQKALDETERGLGDLAAEAFPFEVTKKMLAQKIATLTAVQICAKNTAIQHVPVSLEMATDKTVRRRTATFMTIKEFQEISWVKHFSDQPGFRGFYAKMSLEGLDIRYYVIAQYETDAALVCELVNDVCLDDFAQYDDLDKCPECGGTGGIDSGGMTPEGHGITIPCPSCEAAKTRATNPADGSAPASDTAGEPRSPSPDAGRPTDDSSGADTGQAGQPS